MTGALYLAAASGVATSILLPVLVRAVQQEFRAQPATLEGGMAARVWTTIWPYFRKYSLLTIFSLLTAVVVVIFLGDTLETWKAAFLAGYAWDSTIQKIAQPK